MTTEYSEELVKYEYDDNRLAKYNQMHEAIIAAQDAHEVVKIKDIAELMRVGSKVAGHYEDEIRCAAIRIEAERRLGQLLIETAKTKERETRGGDRKSKSRDKTLIPPDRVIPKLKDLGVTKNMSLSCRRLAALDKAKFDQAIADGLENFKPLTTAGVLHAASNGTKPKRRRGARLSKGEKTIPATDVATVNHLLKLFRKGEVNVKRLSKELEVLQELIGLALAEENKAA